MAIEEQHHHLVGRPKGMDAKTSYHLSGEAVSGLPTVADGGTFTVLGIETSCDDTGAAVVRSDGVILGESLASQYVGTQWGTAQRPPRPCMPPSPFAITTSAAAMYSSIISVVTGATAATTTTTTTTTTATTATTTAATSIRSKVLLARARALWCSERQA